MVRVRGGFHHDLREHARIVPARAEGVRKTGGRREQSEGQPACPLRKPGPRAEDAGMQHLVLPAAAFAIVAVTSLLTIARYDALPDRVPLGLHFNADTGGNGPRYMIWFFPFVQLGLALDASSQPLPGAIFLTAIVAILYFAQVLTIELSIYGPSRIRYVRFWASFAVLIAAGTTAAFALPPH